MMEYHRYLLRSRGESGLNARSERREFEGALIRVDGLGVACIHPWPELGDATLDEELAALAGGNPLPLAVCALQCAAIDGGARREGRWLFGGLQIPRSHWIAGPNDSPQQIAGNGFDTVKLKLGADLEAAAALVEAWAGTEGIGVLRLDFNESLDAAGFVKFWQQLAATSRAKIEFVEDPFPYDLDQWTGVESQTGADLALDRQAAESGAEWTGWVVAKPAIVPSRKLEELVDVKSRHLVFTSYMDHAIGQCWAAYCAATFRSRANHVAGLLTHERFEPDDFFSALGHDAGVLRPPQGTGLGFDQQLEALPWKSLT